MRMRSVGRREALAGDGSTKAEVTTRSMHTKYRAAFSQKLGAERFIHDQISAFWFRYLGFANCLKPRSFQALRIEFHRTHGPAVVRYSVDDGQLVHKFHHPSIHRLQSCLHPYGFHPVSFFTKVPIVAIVI